MGVPRNGGAVRTYGRGASAGAVFVPQRTGHRNPSLRRLAGCRRPDRRRPGRPAIGGAAQITSNFNKILDNKKLNNLIIEKFYFVIVKVFILYK